MGKPLLKTFVIDIRNGKPSFTSAAQRILFFKFLKQYDGKKVWMTLDTKLPKRSERQNRFYWLYLDIISNETGHTPQELHEAFKAQFLYRDTVKVYGTTICSTTSTTDLSRPMFADYLNEIEMLTGVPLPDTSIFELGLTNDEFDGKMKRK